MKGQPPFIYRMLIIAAAILLFLASCQPQPTPKTILNGQNKSNATAQPSSSSETLIVTATQAHPADTKSQTKTALDPCTYLSVDEITQVLGQKFTQALPSASPRPNCHYLTEADASGYAAKLVVYIFTGSSAPGGFEIGKTAQDEKSEPVTGVGDEAYWSPTLDTLNVLKGSLYFTVQFLGTEIETVDAAKELALKLIDHMIEKGLLK